MPFLWLFAYHLPRDLIVFKRNYEWTIRNFQETFSDSEEFLRIFVISFHYSHRKWSRIVRKKPESKFIFVFNSVHNIIIEEVIWCQLTTFLTWLNIDICNKKLYCRILNKLINTVTAHVYDIFPETCNGSHQNSNKRNINKKSKNMFYLISVLAISNSPMKILIPSSNQPLAGMFSLLLTISLMWLITKLLLYFVNIDTRGSFRMFYRGI